MSTTPTTAETRVAVLVDCALLLVGDPVDYPGHLQGKYELLGFSNQNADCGVALGVAAMSVHAVPIQGNASLGFGSMQLSFGEVDWNPALNHGIDLTRTYGVLFTSGATNTGSFATGGMTGQTLGSVQDMSSHPGDANYTAVGAGLTPNFIQFNAQPGWLFVMDLVSPGSFAGMPFLFTQQGANVSAQLAVSGWACDTGGDGLCDLDDDRSIWIGNFFTNYFNVSGAALTASLLGGGTLANSSWTGAIVATADAPPIAPIPEPATYALMMAGLGAIGFVARRRKQKSS